MILSKIFSMVLAAYILGFSPCYAEDGKLPTSFAEYGMQMAALFLAEHSSPEKIQIIEDLVIDPFSLKIFQEYLRNNATDSQIDTILRSVDQLIESRADSPVTFKVPGSLRTITTFGIWWGYNVAVQGWYGSYDENNKVFLEIATANVNSLFMLMTAIAAAGDAMVFADEVSPFLAHRRTGDKVKKFLTELSEVLTSIKNNPENPTIKNESLRDQRILDWLIRVSEPLRIAKAELEKLQSLPSSKNLRNSLTEQMDLFFSKIKFKSQFSKFKKSVNAQAQVLTESERGEVIKALHDLGYQIVIGDSKVISNQKETSLRKIFSKFAREHPTVSFAVLLDKLRQRQEEAYKVHRKVNGFQFLKKMELWLGASIVGMWGIMSNLGFDARHGLDVVVPFLDINIVDSVRSIWPYYSRGFLAAIGVNFVAQTITYPIRSKQERFLRLNNPILSKEEWAVAQRLAFEELVSSTDTKRDLSDIQDKELTQTVDDAYSILAEAKLRPFLPEQPSQSFWQSCKRMGLKVISF